MLFQIPEADAGNQHRKQQEDGRADEKGQEGEPEGGEAACHHGAHSDSDGKGAEQVGGRQGDDGIAETFIYQHPAEERVSASYWLAMLCRETTGRPGFTVSV